MAGTAGLLAGAGLALRLLIALLPRQAPPPSTRGRGPSPARAARSPFDRELLMALRCRTCARLIVNQERDALERWDPTASAAAEPGVPAAEAWRLQLLALDPAGAMRRAEVQALGADRLARTSDERYRCNELLLLIDHELGHRRRELREARRLVHLRPRSARALMILWRASGCSGRPDLQRWAALQLRHLPTDSDALPPRTTGAPGPPP